MISFDQDSPERLKHFCLKQVINNAVAGTARYNFILPSELSSSIAIAFRDHAIANRLTSEQCEDFFRRFSCKYLPLTKISFANLPMTPSAILDFVQEYQNQLQEIEMPISEDLAMSDADIAKLNQLLKRTPTPKSISLGLTTRVKERPLDQDLRLTKLIAQRLFQIDMTNFLPLPSSQTLKYLELSNSNIRGLPFHTLSSLEVLILYNCTLSKTYEEFVMSLKGLNKLRVLDLSKRIPSDDEEDGTHPRCHPPIALDLIVRELPNLDTLDISGMSLMGGKERHISAFEERMSKPFEFLGLFHTTNDAAYRTCLPAKVVAGEANETQILNACEAYMNRREQLGRAVRDLYNLYKTILPSETIGNAKRALDVLMRTLTNHINDETVMIYATAALWGIVKLNATTKNLNDPRLSRIVTNKLLDVMLYHSNRVILINGSLTLIFLSDIICEHSRVAKISLKMCQEDDPRTVSFGVNLLNTLACQVGGDQKVFIGELKAIEIMLDIIKRKIHDETCDETLEYAWSTLWNITDETPINCQRFLSNRGLEIFERCMDKFGSNKEVLRNIMGLLGNVAECQTLRIHFMKPKYIQRFHSLLSAHVDGIECCYNACGILANLVSDGREFWFQHLRKDEIFDEVLREMRHAIGKWPINSWRNINYKSFEPIVRLLSPEVDAAAQYWAVFALANLTRINPRKYCSMLLADSGVAMLRRLVESARTESYVKNLAEVALFQFDKFVSEGSLNGLELCDSINLEVMRNFRVESAQSDDFIDMSD